jgi:hypothetical protein
MAKINPERCSVNPEECGKAYLAAEVRVAGCLSDYEKKCFLNSPYPAPLGNLMPSIT